MKKHALIVILMFTALLPKMAYAQTDDFGLQLSAGASHKLGKKFTVSADVEMRTRNDFRTMDRWTIAFDGAYRLSKRVKFSAGYSLLDDNNKEKINRDANGEITNWRPSYWGLRHRFNVSVTGNVDLGRFNISLRERWQYTYRPEKTVPRYDFDDGIWEGKTVDSSNKHVLRSRLQVEYNIPKSKIDPYASAELFNALSLEKVRCVVGADWKVTKTHSLGVFWRYDALIGDAKINASNRHTFGVAYKFKF